MTAPKRCPQCTGEPCPACAASSAGAGDRCETCGDRAAQWDYDQNTAFCDRHIQQADFTTPLEDTRTDEDRANAIGREYGLTDGPRRAMVGQFAVIRAAAVRERDAQIVAMLKTWAERMRATAMSSDHDQWRHLRNQAGMLVAVADAIEAGDFKPWKAKR